MKVFALLQECVGERYMGKSGFTTNMKAVTHPVRFCRQNAVWTLCSKVSAGQSRSNGSRTLRGDGERWRTKRTEIQQHRRAEDGGQDWARYLCGEAMLPDGGVGVCRRNGSESRYPALLRLALRDRKWEVGEMARVGGYARRQREAAAAAAALRAFDSNGSRQRGGGRKRFRSSKSNGDFDRTCSSSLSCRSSAASTASKNSSSLIRLLGPSCGGQQGKRVGKMGNVCF